MSIRNIKLTVGNVIKGHGILKSYPVNDLKSYRMPLYTLTVEGTDDSDKKQSKDFNIFRFGIHKPLKTSPAKVVGLADQQTHIVKKYKHDYRLHSVEGTPYNASDGAWVVWKTFYIHDGADDPQTEAFGTIGCVEVCDPDGFIKLNDFIISLSGSTKTTKTDKLIEIGASGKMKVTYLRTTRPPLEVIGE